MNKNTFNNGFREDGYIKKSQNIKRSVTFTPTMLKQLDTLAVKYGTSTSQLIRNIIEKGLVLEKSKEDIDFIRKQIREELEIAFDKRMGRIIKLLIKIGSLTYPAAYYTAMLGAAMSARHKLNYHQMLEDAKREGARYLGVSNEAVDLAYDEMSRFNTDV
ncbi:MAG: hypothetical protein FWB98_00035 [Defluviitaleaceae bacterium]|nr:hypothetical protein [Defluviitaleaceae bacterium]